ncbi:ADP-ribosylglycohydrolase family protein [Marivita sp. S0852]|uniref:ADP-ribosylglycohydrolase family protein n=1 Tax=Marivita sp. S0852 TaxID=3373893 RepID=UPI003981FA76
MSATETATPTSGVRVALRRALRAMAQGDALGGFVDKRCRSTLSPADAALLEVALSGGRPEDPRFAISDDTILPLLALRTAGPAGHINRDAYAAALRASDSRGGYQINKLRACPRRIPQAVDGATNGAVLRSLAAAHAAGPDAPGELVFETVKLVSITHGDHNALTAAVVFGLLFQRAMAGDTLDDAVMQTVQLERELRDILDGGAAFWCALRSALELRARARGVADMADRLEHYIGLHVGANSSPVFAIAMAAFGFGQPETLCQTILRRAPRWDIDSTGAMLAALLGAFGDPLPTTLGAQLVEDWCTANGAPHLLLADRAA